MQATNAAPSVYSEQSGYLIIDDRKSYLNLSSPQLDPQYDIGIISAVLGSNNLAVHSAVIKGFDTSTFATKKKSESFKSAIYEKIRMRFESALFQDFLDQIRIYDNADGEFDGMDLLSSYIDDLLISKDTSFLNAFIVQFLMRKFSYQYHIHLLMLTKHKEVDCNIKDALIQSATQAGKSIGRSNVETVIEFAK